MCCLSCLKYKQSMRCGRESWLSGYGRRLMLRRSWVQIPGLYTVWLFFHIPVCYKNCIDVCLKKTENTRNRGWEWPIKKTNYDMGDRISSMDPSASSIMRPYVRIPSTSELFLKKFNCYMERTKINKRPGLF